MSADPALFQLLRLASPGLPVGAYCYSQGLETAIDAGLVADPPSALRWLGDVLGGPMAHFDGALVGEAWRAAHAPDEDALRAINATVLASRETNEQRLETVQMGYSLRTLLEALPESQGLRWPDPLDGGVSFPVAWAIAGERLGIARRATVGAYLYGWLENQVLVLMKAMPIGHTSGQQLLSALMPALDRATTIADELEPRDLTSFAPMLGWAAMRHETQYSRLFRS